MRPDPAWAERSERREGRAAERRSRCTPMSVKSESPQAPGSCVWRKITSRSGPCNAPPCPVRRSSVRRTPLPEFGVATQEFGPGPRPDAGRAPPSSIGTTSASKTSARGIGAAPIPRDPLLRRQARILLDAVGRRRAKSRPRRGDGERIGRSVLHEEPHLVIGHVAARHERSPEVGKEHPGYPSRPRSPAARTAPEGTDRTAAVAEPPVGLRPPCGPTPAKLFFSS